MQLNAKKYVIPCQKLNLSIVFNMVYSFIWLSHFAVYLNIKCVKEGWLLLTHLIILMREYWHENVYFFNTFL